MSNNKIKSIFVPRLIGRTYQDIQFNDNLLHEKSNITQGPVTRSFRWYKELVVSSADGSTSEYDLSMEPYDSTNMLMVFINGLLQRYHIDYTVTGKTITFSRNVRSGSNVIAVYNYK